MKNCHNCQTELLTDISLSGRSLRCAACGALTSIDSADDGKAKSHQRAWWCFGLGIACLPLVVLSVALLLNRIPRSGMVACGSSIVLGSIALYFGITALLRMRYVKATTVTKVAAVTGSLSGGCFGMCLGGIAAIIALVAIVVIQTSESTNEPEAAFAMYQKMMHIDFPDDCSLKPYRANSSPLMFGRVDFRDNEDVLKCNSWLRVFRFPRWTTANRAQFNKIIHDEIYGTLGRNGLEKLETETRKWEIDGTGLTVKKQLWTRTTANKDGTTKQQGYEQYFVLADNADLTHGLSMIHEIAKSGLSEDDIKKIFTSFRSRF